MGTFQDLKELMQQIIAIENRFTEFYDGALNVVTDTHCRQVLELLREKHVCNLRILRDINIDEYGFDEWTRNIPGHLLEEFTLPTPFTGASSMHDMAQIILAFEWKMKDLYSSIADEIVSRDEKELFDSLARFKEKQIHDIHRCISE